MLLKSVECAPHLKARKRITNKISTKRQEPSNETSTPLRVTADEENPYDPDLEETWCKARKKGTPRYAGKLALQRLFPPKKIDFRRPVEMREKYYKKMCEMKLNIIIFQYHFNDLWCCLYNECYNSLNHHNFLTTEIVYVAISLIIKKSNAVCLDAYQVSKILEHDYNIDNPRCQKEIQLCNQYRYVIVPICKASHWILAVIDFEKFKIITYDPLEPVKRIFEVGKKINHFAHEIINYFGKPLHKFEIISKSSLPHQNDGFNCGPLIIYATEFLINGKRIEGLHSEDPETNRVSLINYRLYLKSIISENSESMAHNCMSCFGKLTSTTATLECRTCRRFIHVECEDEIKFINKECVICIQSN